MEMGIGIKTYLAPKGHFLMYFKMLSVTLENKNDIVLNINLFRIYKISWFQWQPTMSGPDRYKTKRNTRNGYCASIHNVKKNSLTNRRIFERLRREIQIFIFAWTFAQV